MANLGVAHLAVRKTYCHTAGIALHKGFAFHKTTDNGCISHSDGICFGIVIESVAIKDH